LWLLVIGRAPQPHPISGAIESNWVHRESARTHAEYRHSDTAFTRDVDVLPAGQRLQNWGASCGVGYQGTVTP
jgi:hypothetical protein